MSRRHLQDNQYHPLPRSSLLAVLLAVLACLLSRGAWEPAARAADAADAKLVVTKAYYGDLPDGAKTDVTDKVAALVKEGRLSVEASNDNFGDPAEGVVKKLRVEYAVDGVARSKTVDEGQTLTVTSKPSKIVIRKAVYGDLPDGPKADVTKRSPTRWTATPSRSRPRTTTSATPPRAS